MKIRIVFEGQDATGKSSMAKAVKKFFESGLFTSVEDDKLHFSGVELHKFPSQSLLDSLSSKTIKEKTAFDNFVPFFKEFGENSEYILNSDNVLHICDRFYPSAIAYQGIASRILYEREEEIKALKKSQPILDISMQEMRKSSGEIKTIIFHMNRSPSQILKTLQERGEDSDPKVVDTLAWSFDKVMSTYKRIHDLEIIKVDSDNHFDLNLAFVIYKIQESISDLFSFYG